MFDFLKRLSNPGQSVSYYWDFNQLIEQTVALGLADAGMTTSEWKLPNSVHITGDTLKMLQDTQWATEQDNKFRYVTVYGISHDHFFSQPFTAASRVDCWGYFPKIETKVEADPANYQTIYIRSAIDGVERYQKHLYRSEYYTSYRQTFPVARFAFCPIEIDQKTQQPFPYTFIRGEIKNFCYQKLRQLNGAVYNGQIFLAITTKETALIEEVANDAHISIPERMKILHLTGYQGSLQTGELTRFT